ncbi:uncharacterized protein LOC105847919 isoform X5 [Hydra vulgaris]|uniref:Uncharacterized protein LOC105847919 isoform X5 n=1 Tax=Hydra vulgaris TaxID=6087 RepID=A0ABM4B9M4_HYDVU
MHPGYNSIDLLNLYNIAINKYSRSVNYIGIIIMPDNESQNDTYCKFDKKYTTLSISNGKDQLQLLSVETFHTKIRLFQFENVLINSVLFGQYYDYPSTSLFAYNVNLTSDVIVASLNFSIDGFFDSFNFNSLKVRVYLLVSQDNLFNNTFKSLKNMLYTYSKLYLKEQFVSFVMQPGYNCIDLLIFYNNAINNHFGFVNYIGIVVMPNDKLQTNVFCKAYNNRIKLGISYKKGYYGRGIYLDNVNWQIYLCKNQHATILQKSACYISKDYGVLWEEIDIRIGAILGHHILSQELYAMHRNQKLYLVFSSMLKKWLAVTNHEFKDIANDLNWTQLKTLEGDSDKVINFGKNQLMGNESGLFFRKSINDIWNQSFKWDF